MEAASVAFIAALCMGNEDFFIACEIDYMLRCPCGMGHLDPYVAGPNLRALCAKHKGIPKGKCSMFCSGSTPQTTVINSTVGSIPIVCEEDEGGAYLWKGSLPNDTIYFGCQVYGTPHTIRSFAEATAIEVQFRAQQVDQCRLTRSMSPSHWTNLRDITIDFLPPVAQMHYWITATETMFPALENMTITHGSVRTPWGVYPDCLCNFYERINYSLERRTRNGIPKLKTLILFCQCHACCRRMMPLRFDEVAEFVGLASTRSNCCVGREAVYAPGTRSGPETIARVTEELSLKISRIAGDKRTCWFVGNEKNIFRYSVGAYAVG